MRRPLRPPFRPLFFLLGLVLAAGCSHTQRLEAVEHELSELRREVRAHQRAAQLQALEVEAQRDVDRALEMRKRRRQSAAAEPVKATPAAAGQTPHGLRPWPASLDVDTRP